MFRRLWLPIGAAVAVAAGATGAVFLLGGGDIKVAGLGTVVGKDQLPDLRVRVTAKGVDRDTLRAEIDGTPVQLVRDGTGYVITPRALRDGSHQLRVTGDGASVSHAFSVDTHAPPLTVHMPTSGVRLDRPVTVTGSTEDGARLSAAGGKLSVDGSTFRVTYPTPPTSAVLVATDAAGNATRKTFRVPVTYPKQVRAVHLSGYAWAYEPFRKSALTLLEERRINAVQLDVKEEDGIVNTDLDVPLAKQIKAITKKYDAEDAIRTLHAAGARVIGRVVAFRDPVLAKWAWQHDHRDWTVQSPGGGPYSSGYGASEFANFANPSVQEYNLDIAEAAVRAGFDDIVFDYIRRPDGALSSMMFPGIRGSAGKAIADFCEAAEKRLHAAGGYVGAAIFAQAVLHPEDTAQDVPAMARHLDLVVPMDYPNHWSDGSYGVANPASDTYPIVHRSLVDWVKAVRGTGCAVVPWLWASDVLGAFSVHQAAEEIRGARDAGLPGWFLWNAEAHYEKWAPAFSADAGTVR
jgi:hypothetical protein